MQGRVDVYKIIDDHRELVESGSNMILDGWSEYIVDMLTFNPYVYGTQYSALLDVSNFTIRAVSYAKSPSGYLNNAHGNHPITLSGRNSFPTPQIWVVNQVSTVSSYQMINSIPSYPAPDDRILQLLPSSVSSVIVQFGQNLNAIVHWASVPEISSLGVTGAYALGCYTVSNGSTGRLSGALFTEDGTMITSTLLGLGNDNTGFNGTPLSMDWRGFQTRHPTNKFAGLVVSSLEADIRVTPTIKLLFTLTRNSMTVAALYGGIQSVGIWGLDLKATLAKGKVPPFTANPATPDMEYRLLAKKVFMNNLCYIEDVGGTAGINAYSNIDGEWTVEF